MTSKLGVGWLPLRRRPRKCFSTMVRTSGANGRIPEWGPRRRGASALVRAPSRNRFNQRNSVVRPTPRTAMASRICSPEGRSGSVERISARRCAVAQSRRSMLSTSMDSLAISLQSGSTNYESNSTPVPGIVNQSRNCATGKSLDFNDRESHKLRLSDIGFSRFVLDWFRASFAD